GSYSTLSVVCAGFKPVFFCYNCDRSTASCFQGESETSDSAADDEIIELIFHCGFPILRSKSRCRISELRTSDICHPTSLVIRRVQLILCNCSSTMTINLRQVKFQSGWKLSRFAPNV